MHVYTDAPDSGDEDEDAKALADRITESGATWVIWTTGFERLHSSPAVGAAGSEVALPQVSWRGRPLDLSTAEHDALGANAITGAAGLYGVGIGFPAAKVDPEGLREAWVGFGSDAIDLVERIIIHEAESELGGRGDTGPSSEGASPAEPPRR